MQATFIMFGVTGGFSSMKCTDAQSQYFSRFYRPGVGQKVHIGTMPNNDVVYTRLIYPSDGKAFTDMYGRRGSFIGTAIILHDRFLTRPDRAWKLLETLYDKYINGIIVKTNSVGNMAFTVPTLASPQIQVYIMDAINKLITEHPELNFTPYVAPYSSMNKIAQSNEIQLS